MGFINLKKTNNYMLLYCFLYYVCCLNVFVILKYVNWFYNETHTDPPPCFCQSIDIFVSQFLLVFQMFCVCFFFHAECVSLFLVEVESAGYFI